MKSKDPPQAKCRVKVPCLPATTECTAQRNLAPIRVAYRLPHSRPLEVLEHPSKQHILPLLLRVNASRPVAHVETITSEPAGEQLIPLLAADSPRPGSQMGSCRADLMFLPLLGGTGADSDGSFAWR